MYALEFIKFEIEINNYIFLEDYTAILRAPDKFDFREMCLFCYTAILSLSNFFLPVGVTGSQNRSSSRCRHIDHVEDEEGAPFIGQTARFSR